MSFDKDKSGLIDPGGVLRNSYRDSESAIDVITNGNPLVPAKYSRVALTRNSKCYITQAAYYNDNIFEVTKVVSVADVAGSLNNKYFTIYSGQDNTKYYVWFSVDGGGTDPNLVNCTGVQINLISGDSAIIVAAAIQLNLGALSEFTTTRCGNEVTITTVIGGDTTNSVDIDTGFTITTETEGDSTLVATLLFTYNSHNKITDVVRR